MTDLNPSPAAPPADPYRPRPILTDLAIIGGCLFVLALLTVAVSAPWLDGTPWQRTGANWLQVADGQASLQVVRDAEGTPLRWSSTSVYEVPVRQVVAGRAGKAASYVLENEYPDMFKRGDIPGVEVYELHSRKLDAAGQLSDESVWLLQDAHGTRLFAYTQPANGVELTFTPPYPAYPTDPQGGDRWRATGVRSDNAAYEVNGEVLAQGVYTAGVGMLDECVQMDARTVFTITAGGQSAEDVTAFPSRTASWECPTVGTITWDVFDGDGNLTERGEVLAASDAPGRVSDASAYPPKLHVLAAQEEASVALERTDEWSFSRVARVRPLHRNNASSSFAPVYVPAEPPFLLVGVVSGDLNALDPDTGAIRWRFNPGGTVYAPPTVDLRQGRIFFGSSGKSFYALDLNGFFLWSFTASDNIPTRPLLVGDGLVVFGSEDRNFYALDAATGALRWSYDTGSPIASSPAAYARPGKSALVIFGSDGGGVYALDTTNGSVVWQVATEKAVEAPVVVADDVAYIASRDGNLYALDAATGAQRWIAVVGSVLRVAPVVSRDHVYVVDQIGSLYAFRRAGGSLAWRLEDVAYGAAPLLVGSDSERLLAPRYAAGTDLLDADGNRIQTWDAAAARLGVDLAQAVFQQTPTAGGGAFWLADSDGVFYRLGQAQTSAGGDQAELAWQVLAGMFPFESEYLYTSPVVVPQSAPDDANADALVVMDLAGTLYRIDAAAGSATRIGKPATEQYMRGVEPVAASLDGRPILLATFDDLIALDAESAAVLWQASGREQHALPPVVSGETALWLTTDSAENGIGPGEMVALNLRDGEPQWRAPIDAQPLFGGVAANEETVITAAPPTAYDLESGVERWRAPEGVTGLGIPAIAGDLAFVGTYDFERAVGSIRALELADGAERWKTDLPGDDALNLMGRIWVSGDTLIVPSFGGAILAFNAADGAILWQQRLPDAPVGGITVEGGRVYTLLNNGDLVVLDANTGEERARARSEQENLSDAILAQRPTVWEAQASDGGSQRYVVTAIGLSLLGFEVAEDTTESVTGETP